MIVYEDLLREIASEKKHTFISTGMSMTTDIDLAVRVFRDANCSFELMHCVSTYPMDDRDANLRRIKTLRDSYKCNVGYSGHETGLAISYGAVSYGISSLERHITLDRSMWGTDHSASLEPAGLQRLVRDIRIVEEALGDGVKQVYRSEIPVRAKLRRVL